MDLVGTGNRASLRLALVTVLTFVLLLATGCDQGLTAGVGVDNQTSLELRFRVLLPDGWYDPVARAHPYSTALVLPVSVLPASGCTSGAMVAIADDGREVARHEAPLCNGDRWVIGTAESS